MGSRYLPAHEPSDQQGRHPGQDPPTPHQRATQTPSEGKPSTTSQASPGRRSQLLIHFSQTSSNVMRNWCRPVAQHLPSWRHWVGFWGPCGEIIILIISGIYYCTSTWLYAERDIAIPFLFICLSHAAVLCLNQCTFGLEFLTIC